MITILLKQRHVESLARALREAGISLADVYEGIPRTEAGNMRYVDLIERHGIIARAAAEAGMLNGTDPNELEPWETGELCDEVIRAVMGSLSRPKVSVSTQPITPMPSLNTDKATVLTTS